MDLPTLEDTGINEYTMTLEKFHDLMSPILSKPMLTPKEANQLTYHLTEILMVNNCEPRVLRVLARYLSKKAYDDILEERIIEHHCGYPICKFSDSKKIKDMQVNSLVKSLKMPRYYNSRFCCKNHYLCSEFYRNQLSAEALFMRINLDKPWMSDGSVENDIVLLDDYINIKEKGVVVDDLNNVIEMLRQMNVEDSHAKSSNKTTNTQELIDHLETFKVVEHEGKQESENVYDNKES